MKTESQAQARHISHDLRVELATTSAVSARSSFLFQAMGTCEPPIDSWLPNCARRLRVASTDLRVTATVTLTSPRTETSKLRATSLPSLRTRRSGHRRG